MPEKILIVEDDLTLQKTLAHNTTAQIQPRMTPNIRMATRSTA